MLNYTESSIPALQIQVDQSFASRVMKKYSWTFGSGKKVKLEHKGEQSVTAKRAANSNIVLSPQIHIHQVIQPLHLTVMMQHLTFSQIPVYKQQLIVSPEEVEQRKNNAFVVSPKVQNMTKNKVINNQLTRNTVNLENSNVNTQTVSKKTISKKSVKNETFNEFTHIDNRSQMNAFESNLQHSLTTEQLVKMNVSEKLLRNINHKQMYLQSRTSLLKQLMQHFQQDKLLTQLNLQYEQQQAYLNSIILNQKHILNQHSNQHGHEHINQHNNQHSHEHSNKHEHRNQHEYRNVNQQLEHIQTNRIDHKSIDAISNQITDLQVERSVILRHNEIIDASTTHEAVNKTNVHNTVKVDSSKVEHIKLEYTEISQQNHLRNLLNIKRNVQIKPVTQQLNHININAVNNFKSVDNVQQSDFVVKQQIDLHAVETELEQAMQKRRGAKAKRNNKQEEVIANQPNQVVEHTKNVVEKQRIEVIVTEPYSDNKRVSLAYKDIQVQQMPQVNTIQMINNNDIYVHTKKLVEKIKQRYQKHRQPIKLEIVNRHNKRKAKQDLEQVEVSQQNTEVSHQNTFIKATIKNTINVEQQAISSTELILKADKIEQSQLVIEQVQNTNHVKPVYMTHENEVDKKVIKKVTKIVQQKPTRQILNHHIRITTDHIVRSQRQIVNKKLIKQEKAFFMNKTRNVFHQNKQLNLVTNQLDLVTNQLEQVTVNSIQTKEASLIQREQQVTIAKRQKSSNNDNLLKRQPLQRENEHVSLHVKKQNTEEKTIVSTQVGQLKQQVKMLESQIEQQNENIKQSTQRVNIKQLSNQIYDELTRRIKLEKQRLGR